MNSVHRITLLTNPDVCNLSCPLCFLRQRGCAFKDIFGIEGEMDFVVAKAAIEKFAESRNVNGERVLREVIPSTMGEPLLYSQFGSLLNLCESLKLPINLTTNGTFPGQWGEPENLSRLLKACSDIKLSSLASECFGGWKGNVEKLMDVRHQLMSANHTPGNVATVTLQTTLHRKNLMMIPELIAWAATLGIHRIKWNKVVLLSCASQALRDEFGLDRDDLEIRRLIVDCSKMAGDVIKNEGSLFAQRPSGSSSYSQDAGTCPFANELWILPDGSEQHCPSPERRFGNEKSAEARCCFL